MVKTINKLIRTSRHLLQQMGREPSPEEIAAEMEILVEKVMEIKTQQHMFLVFLGTPTKNSMIL